MEDRFLSPQPQRKNIFVETGGKERFASPSQMALTSNRTKLQEMLSSRQDFRGRPSFMDLGIKSKFNTEL